MPYLTDCENPFVCEVLLSDVKLNWVRKRKFRHGVRQEIRGNACSAQTTTLILRFSVLGKAHAKEGQVEEVEDSVSHVHSSFTHTHAQS